MTFRNLIHSSLLAVILAGGAGSLSCASTPPVTQAEAGVVTAALAADWSTIGIRNHERERLIAPETAYWESQSLDPGFLRAYGRLGDINLTVSSSLLAMLPKANKTHVAVSPSWLPPGYALLPIRDSIHSYLSISRPAITADQAVVAITLWPPGSAAEGSCISGFIILLQHEEGVWAVAGFSGMWIT
jgi:hypothetical protein